jgi:hypothetical protein
VDGLISVSVFWPKTFIQGSQHEQGHCYDARSKHQAKVQVFSDKQPYISFQVTELVHSLILFNKREVNSAFVIRENKHCFS